MRTLTVVASHGAENDNVPAPASGDRGRRGSTSPGLDAERAAATFAALLAAACQAARGGQKQVAESLGITPQLLNRCCDARNPKPFGSAKIALLAEREPEVFEALQLGLRALAKQRRVLAGASPLALAVELSATASALLVEAHEASKAGRLDAERRKRLGQELAKLGRQLSAFQEALAASRTAELLEDEALPLAA